MHSMVSLYTQILIIQGLLMQVVELSEVGRLPFLGLAASPAEGGQRKFQERQSVRQGILLTF